MRSLSSLLVASCIITCAVAIANTDVDPSPIDWNTIRTLQETDKFRAKYGLPPLSDDDIRQSRISGGTIASPTDIPWAAGVLIHGETSGHSFCSGVLISKRYVLTAAVCISGESTLTVALNSTDMMSVGTLISVSHINSHPNYSGLLGRNDIALLTLSRDAPVDNVTIRPVQMPRRSDVGKSFVDWSATTAGWGNTGNRDNEPIPTQHLQFATDSVSSNLICQLSYAWIRSTHICVATNNGGPCNGDEGGPVTVREAGRIYLIGIHSFHFNGIRGCDRGRPAVHTRITEYLDWIEANSDVVIPQ